MKKSRSLLILTAILVALGGVYAFSSLNPKKAEEPALEPSKIKLSVIDSKKIVKMSLNSSNGILSFEKSGDLWRVKQNPDMKIDQIVVEDVVTGFANIYGDKVVAENPENLEEFGLKPSVVTATVLLDDGSSIELYLGNKTPQGDSYYMMFKGDAKLYTIEASVSKGFYYALSDVRDKKVMALSMDNLNYIKIVNKVGKTIELKKAAAGSLEEAEYGADSWMATKPYNSAYPVDNGGVSSIIDNISGISIDKFVEDNPSDYSKYGLDKPVMEITAKDGAATFQAYIGKDTEDEYVYFRVEGSKAVYAMDKNKLTALNTKPFDLVDKYIAVSLIDDVDQVIIDNLGVKSVMTLNRVTKPAQNAGDKDEVVTTFKIDGKDVAEDNARIFYQQVSGLLKEADNDKKIAEKPDIKITYILNKGEPKQVSISFCSYNTDFYAVFKDGKSDFLISKAQVQVVMDGLQKLKTS